MQWPDCPARSGSEVDTMKITDDDAAFILGKGGKTKARALGGLEEEEARLRWSQRKRWIWLFLGLYCGASYTMWEYFRGLVHNWPGVRPERMFLFWEAWADFQWHMARKS